MRTISPSVLTEINERSITDYPSTASLSPQRRDLIEQIGRINASATTDFLGRFADKALRVYLDHLHCTQQPRGRAAVWVRPGDTAAANTAETVW